MQDILLSNVFLVTLIMNIFHFYHNLKFKINVFQENVSFHFINSEHYIAIVA